MPYQKILPQQCTRPLASVPGRNQGRCHQARTQRGFVLKKKNKKKKNLSETVESITLSKQTVQVQNLNLILTILYYTGKFSNSLGFSFLCHKMRKILPFLNENLHAKYLSQSKFSIQINNSCYYYTCSYRKESVQDGQYKGRINISTCSSLKNVMLSTATYIF